MCCCDLDETHETFRNSFELRSYFSSLSLLHLQLLNTLKKLRYGLYFSLASSFFNFDFEVKRGTWVKLKSQIPVGEVLSLGLIVYFGYEVKSINERSLHEREAEGNDAENLLTC